MPSRLITALILAFWLGMTGILLQREVVPMMLAEVAPTFQIDLTDEIGSPLVGWSMLADGKRVGSATSKINALDDRRYEFRSHFQFDDSAKFMPGLKTIETMDRVSEDGKLLALSMMVVLNPYVFEIEGEVVAKKLKPRILWDKKEFPIPDLGEIDMASQGNLVSALKLVSRLRGLHEGQTWSETPFDASRGLKGQFADILKPMQVSSLIALVKTDTIEWDRKKVDCHLIEYHDANKDVVARVWARKRDGLVLQREVSILGKELTLQRVPH